MTGAQKLAPSVAVLCPLGDSLKNPDRTEIPDRKLASYRRRADPGIGVLHHHTVTGTIPPE